MTHVLDADGNYRAVLPDGSWSAPIGTGDDIGGPRVDFPAVALAATPFAYEIEFDGDHRIRLEAPTLEGLRELIEDQSRRASGG